MGTEKGPWAGTVICALHGSFVYGRWQLFQRVTFQRVTRKGLGTRLQGQKREQ
jgi:hypothetical protein